VDVQGVVEILERYHRQVQPLAAPEFLGGAGGLSGARLWRYRAERGLLVLRAWPPHGPGRAHLQQIHRWLFRARDLGFVPVPISDQAGRSLQEADGQFWEVTPWLAGSAEPADAPTRQRVRSAFTALATFHQRLAAEQHQGVSPGLVQRYATITQLIQGGFDLLEAVITDASGPDQCGRQNAALRWVRLARTVALRLRDSLREAAARVAPLQPCLRDARPDHFLFEGDRLSGLVDFGAMGIDSVAGDLARLMSEWLHHDPPARAEALAAYERIEPLGTAWAAQIADFESSSALLMAERWIRWHYLENRRFDDPQAVTQGISRGLRRLERLMGSDHLGSSRS
jgi:homoserine kinase type II